MDMRDKKLGGYFLRIVGFWEIGGSYKEDEDGI